MWGGLGAATPQSFSSSSSSSSSSIWFCSIYHHRGLTTRGLYRLKPWQHLEILEDEDENESDNALVTPTTACMPEHHPRRGQRDRSPSRSRKLSRDNA